MKRPVAFFALFYVLGLLYGRFLLPEGALLWAHCSAAAAFAAAGLYFTGRRVWLLAPVFFALGAFLAFLALRPGAFDALDGRLVSVSGVVTDVNLTDYGTQILTVDVSRITADGTEQKYNKKISVITKSPKNVLYGQGVLAVGTAERLGFKRNPGGFSEEWYMRARGFGGKLTDAEITPGKMERPFVFYIRESSKRISAAFHNALPEDMAGIMDAVVLGEKGAVPGDVRDNFRKTGASHILSISGLHLSILAGFLLAGFKYAGLRLRGGALATLASLWAYCVFTGFSVSTVRAVIMLSVFLFGYIIYRTPDIFVSAALAALIILVKNPLFLWDAGFLLSFSAVLGIALLTPVISRYLRRLDFKRLKLSSYISATLAATIFTMPVSAYFFYYVSISGLAVNALLLPLASLLVEVGFVFVLFNSLFVAGVLASVIYTILFYFLWVTELFAALPFSYVVTGRPSLWNIALYYGAVVSGALYLKAKNADKESAEAKRMKAAFAAALAAAVVLNAHMLFPENELNIAFLDVGQGDAAVLHLPEKIDIMIDGGGNMLREIGDNTGERVVAPYLLSMGKTRLNAVFLTHPDMDHAAGVAEIMERVKVNRLFVPDVNFEGDDGVMDMVLETAERENVPVTRIKAGYSAVISGVGIECLYPTYSGTPKDINSGSLTLKITHGENTLLFTGDIESNDELRLIMSGRDLKSDVLKVPHHGSKTSSTPEFVEAVSPEYALVGSGRGNVFGHPSPEVVKTYEDKGIALYNTAREGAVFVCSDGERLIIDTMRGKEAERWSN